MNYSIFLIFLDGVKIGLIHSQPRGATSRRCGLC